MVGGGGSGAGVVVLLLEWVCVGGGKAHVFICLLFVVCCLLLLLFCQGEKCVGASWFGVVCALADWAWVGNVRRSSRSGALCPSCIVVVPVSCCVRSGECGVVLRNGETW